MMERHIFSELMTVFAALIFRTCCGENALPRRVLVLNVFQCHTYCDRLVDCTSVTYDYSTRMCMMNAASDNIQPYGIHSLMERENKVEAQGACSVTICPPGSTCVHAVNTSLCLNTRVTHCEQPPTLRNAILDFASTAVGSTAKVVCISGYNFSGSDDVISCQSSGLWESVKGSCKEINCGAPNTPINGVIVYNDTNYSAVAHIVCDVGYRLTGGSSLITCTQNGTWTDDGGSCTEIDCGIPKTPINGIVIYNTTKFPAKTIVVCDVGYNFTGGTHVLSCATSGAWSSLTGSCVEIDCGPPDGPSDSFMDYTNTTYSSPAYVVCRPGYTLTGDNTTTCSLDGTWTTIHASCVAVDCGNPAALEHGVVHVNGSTFSSVGHVVCDTGYRTLTNTSDLDIYCTADGKWTPLNNSCQIVDCGPPDEHVNGDFLYYNTTYGSAVVITCHTGHVFRGRNNSIQCHSNGSWSTLNGSCSVRDCGRPPSEVYVDTSYNKTTYGSTYTVTCRSGDVMNTSQCTAIGWSNITLSCVDDLVMIDDMVLALRGVPDINISLYHLWNNINAYHDPLAMEPGCLTLNTSLPCHGHFKSKFVTKWPPHQIKEVTYALLKRDKIRHFITFRADSTAQNNWFTSDRVLTSSWIDLTPTNSYNYFGIDGHPENRRFLVNHNYNGCPLDLMWTVIIEGGGKPCSWDNPHTFPKIIYSRNSTSATVTDFEYADGMAILVKMKKES